MRTAIRVACAMFIAAPAPAPAQVIRGTVVADVGRTPVHGARVVARTGGGATVTDRLGRFTIPVDRLPETIVVSAIGWAPDSILVEASDRLVTIALARAAVLLSDLITTATTGRNIDLNSLGRWQLPVAATRAIPVAVEPDVLRTLTLIPAVSFSSPLSARPLLRGYDAEEVTTRVDGFELPNLYHLGRIFASFPADAAEELTVTAAPADPSVGNTVAGVVDITGRTGPADDPAGGASWSYGSLSAFGGGGNNTVRVFGAGRVFYWKSLDLIPGVDLPYHFADLYAGAVFGPASRPAGRVTAFVTTDRAGDPATGRYLDWDNALLGGRWRLVNRAATSLEVSASASRVRQNGRNVPGLHTLTQADLANEFSRVHLSADITHTGRLLRVIAGGSIGYRRIDNRIGPAGADPDRLPLAFDGPTADTRLGRTEVAVHGQLARQIGGLSLEMSGRLDAASSIAVFLPAFRAKWSPAGRLEVSAGLGRTSRLYHLLAETRSEPDFDFLDFWIPAGGEAPAARVDHASVDLSLDFQPLVARLSAFGSRGRGLGGIRPATARPDGGFEHFRFGESRTRGVEAQLTAGEPGSPNAASLTYVWSRSERRFHDGWIPWALDRRHHLRGFGQTRLGRFDVHIAADAASGSPVTPVITYAPGPPLPGSGNPRPGAVPVYGRENSAGTSGTFRVDAGLALRFRGFRRSRMTLGVSVINLFGTATAPFGESGTGHLATTAAGNPTPFRRVFTLPPVPTLLLRAEF